MTDPGDDPRALILHLRQRVAQLEREVARDRGRISVPDGEVGASWFEQTELRDETERISQVGSWSWNLESQEVWWSPETFRILGYVEGEEQPSIERFFAAIHPDDLERLQAHSERMSSTGDTSPARARVVHADGDVLEVDFSAATLRNSAGAPRRIVGTMSDRTAHVRAHEERRQLNEHIAQAQKMDAIGRLAGGVAHDVNNYLLIIDSNAEHVESQITNPEWLEALEDLRLAAGSCRELMQQLMSFSRDHASGEFQVFCSSMPVI